MSKKYYIIYKTTNIKNNKFYIGMHQTNNLDDGYLGSGTRLYRSIKYHGKKNFKRKILHLLNNREEMIQKEIEIVNEKLLKDPYCMNLKSGGEGGGGWFSEEHKQKNLKAFLIAGRKALSEKMKDPEFHANWCKERKKQWENPDYRAKLLPIIRNAFKGKTHSKETKEKMSLSQQGKQKGYKNSQFGTCWITNERDNKKIFKGDIIPKGWRLGRKMKLHAKN